MTVRRRRLYMRETHTSWHRNPGKIYRRLRGPPRTSVLMRRQDEETTDRSVMDSWLLDAWLPIMQRHRDGGPSWELFKERYAAYIPEVPLPLQPLSGEQLHMAAADMGSGKAPGTDGCTLRS